MKAFKVNVRLLGFGLLLALLAMGLGGCLVIPQRHAATGDSRTNITHATSQQFTPGRTTMPELILALGEPDAVSSDELTLVYRLEHRMLVGGGIVAVPFGGTAIGGRLIQEGQYIFDFDKRGILVSTNDTLHTLWANSGQLSDITFFQDGPGLHPILKNKNPPFDHDCAVWYQGGDRYSRLKDLFSWGIAGRLVISDSTLYFFPHRNFANAPPALAIALSSVQEVRAAGLLLSRRLVVKDKAGRINTFQLFTGRDYRYVDKEALKKADDLIRLNNPPSVPAATQF